MADLFVPDDVNDADTLTAAMKYAAAGWFVLPVRPETKHPGSVLGRAWQTQSSRDPKTIATWFTGTNHAIALHVGRSGGIVFDVDDPDAMPDVLHAAVAELEPPFQSTRVGEPLRGHYVFAAEPGRYGNSLGSLGRGWGEVRGWNGIIVVAPSVHAKAAAGGRYKWMRTGPVPELPPALAAALRPPSSSAGNVGTTQARGFLAGLLPGPACRAVAAVPLWMPATGRHDTMRDLVLRLVRLGEQGHRGVREALAELEERFIAAVAPDRAGGGLEAAAEYDRALAGAVAVVQAKPTPEADRGCCPDLPPVYDLGEEQVAEESAGGPPEEPAEEPAVGESFWQRTERLEALARYARGKMVSPWATLGCVLALTVARVGPHVVLPDIVGARGSLNLLVGLVGQTGAGKTAAYAVARGLVSLPETLPEHELGTGQGIESAYTQPVRKGQPVHFCDAAVFTLDEIGSLAAHANLPGGRSVIERLKSAYSGARLGARYADLEKRRPVPAHRYRFVLIAGIQPPHAGVILDDPDGGFPQRWLWMDAHDPAAPDDPPPAAFEDELACAAVVPPDMAALGEQPEGVRPRGFIELEVCDAAVAAIRAARLAGLRGEAGRDLLASHRLLTQLKVAAALALWHERQEVTDQDWELAAAVVAHSDAVRARCERAIASKRSEANRAQAHAEAEREEIREDAAVKRTARLVLARLTDDWTPRAELRRTLPGRDRGYFDAAVAALVTAGQVEVQESGYHGRTVTRYRRSHRA